MVKDIENTRKTNRKASTGGCGAGVPRVFLGCAALVFAIKTNEKTIFSDLGSIQESITEFIVVSFAPGNAYKTKEKQTVFKQ